uniref:Response regulatory domain-containing protein n=1 Tax=Opuntia streptacantha TaxID=393608 RepID=A0A7C8YP91_OPUST
MLLMMSNNCGRCLEGGAEEFLLKPVSLSDLKKLRPYILKSTSTTATASRHSREETNTIGAGSSCNLVVNCNTNYDYKEGIMSDDKGQGKVKADNESFDARPNLAGLTAA